MNKGNYIQSGGFPLKVERLDEIQKAYSVFNNLGYLAGNHIILSGCVTTGTNVSNGYVIIDGEVLEFRGGSIAGGVNVIIVENPISKEFKNGASKVIYIERWATFGTSDGSIPWTNFRKPDTLIDLSGRLLPPGTNPQMYCGSLSDIPQGWQLCDGSNGTPDLRGKFVMGVAPLALPWPGDEKWNVIGDTGGSAYLNKHPAVATFGVDNLMPYENGEPGVKQYKTLPPYFVLAFIIYIG